MWMILVLLLLRAQLNLTALVPLQPNGPPPPWWVGGRLIWPFAVETRMLIPKGDLLNALTPVLGIVAATCFLLAAAVLLRWAVPAQWFPWLIVAAAASSVVLQVIWFSGWAMFPLLVDLVLLRAVFGQHITVAGLRGSPGYDGRAEAADENDDAFHYLSRSYLVCLARLLSVCAADPPVHAPTAIAYGTIAGHRSGVSGRIVSFMRDSLCYVWLE